MSRPSADRREEQVAGLTPKEPANDLPIRQAWKQVTDKAAALRALAARESNCCDTPGPVDHVNHPPHYTFGKYEVLDVLMDWFPAEPLLWQVCKYIARASHKGAMLQDLKKARFYLERRIAAIEKDTP